MTAKRRGFVSLCALLAACASSPSPQRDAALRWRGPPALEREFHTVARALLGAGLRGGGPALGGFLIAGNHATLPVVIPKGECVTFVSRATRGARDVDAALYTADGTLLALDSESDAHPSLQACANEVAAKVYYVIQFYEGDGSFLVASFFGPRSALVRAAAAVGGKPAFAEIVPAPEVSEDPLAAFTEGLRKRGYETMGQAQRFPITEGERVRENLRLEAGRCYTVAAFSKGMRELRLRLMDARDTELSVAGEGVTPVATQLCANATGVYSLEAIAQAGTGEVLLMVFSADAVTAGGEAGLWLGQRPLAAKAPAP